MGSVAWLVSTVGPVALVFFNAYAGPTVASLAASLALVTRVQAEAASPARRAGKGAASKPASPAGGDAGTLSILLPIAACSVNLAVCAVAQLLMADHLFLWSVFSPKFAYACNNTLAAYFNGALCIAALL